MGSKDNSTSKSGKSRRRKSLAAIHSPDEIPNESRSNGMDKKSKEKQHRRKKSQSFLDANNDEDEDDTIGEISDNALYLMSLSEEDRNLLSRRRMIISEIISTEKTYLLHLQTAIKVFLLPLRQSFGSKQEVSIEIHER